MIYGFLLLIIAIGYNFFTLIPGYHIEGVFRLTDVGLLLIFISFARLFYISPHRQVIFNGVGLMVLLYLFMILIHVAIANINYNQTILSGLIASRHQFYYVSYFVFLLALHQPGRSEKFMRYLSGLAIMVLVLSAVNYSGLKVFHHVWAEGHGIRAGITRTFIPGMNLIVMIFMWYLVKYLVQGTSFNRNGLMAFVFFLGILFRQTRGRIIAATLASAWAMYRERQLKTLAFAGVAVLVLGLVLGLVMKENVLTESYQSAITDIQKEEGTWAGRAVTLRHALDTYMEHPVVGSGALVIRQTDTTRITSDLLKDAYQGDLGYVHWLKNFGSIGIVWLIALCVIAWKRTRENRRARSHDTITLFAEYQLVHIAISFVTINYAVKPEGILVICLTLALLHCRSEEVAVPVSARQIKRPTANNSSTIQIARTAAILQRRELTTRHDGKDSSA